MLSHQTAVQPREFAVMVEGKATHHNNVELKTIYKAELPYISTQVTSRAFAHLDQCDPKATQCEWTGESD